MMIEHVALTARLRAAGSVFAEDEAALLLGAATSEHDLDAMVRRRVAGEPLEVVVGWADFCGERVVVEPGVFVPRARTAVLVEHGVAHTSTGAVVVDLCCGTGAVGVAVRRRVPDVELHAADLDPAAVRCARRNVEPGGGHVHQGDLLDALPASLRGRVDVLVVNAPYVPTDAIESMPPEARDHEPRTALDGGPDGVGFHRRLADRVADWLSPAGHLLVETSRRQASLTSDAFARAGLEAVVVRSHEVDGTAVLVRPVAGS